MNLDGKAAALYVKQNYSKSTAVDGVEVIDLRRHHDEGGSLTELARFDAGAALGIEGFRLAQINYSTLQPGVIKAFHVHLRQADVWFVPPEDRVLLVLADVRRGSATAGASQRVVLGDGTSRLVRIPPGVAHGCRNLGTTTARVLYLTDEPFSSDPESGDEGRLPWDFLGEGIWEPVRE